jgi:hypothetical protein
MRACIKMIPDLQDGHDLSTTFQVHTKQTVRATENWNDLIGNRTRYLPAGSIVPQSTMMPADGSEV